MAKKGQNFSNFYEPGHSEHASRSAHGPYVFALGASVPASPTDHVAAGHAVRTKPSGVSSPLVGAASGPPIFDFFLILTIFRLLTSKIGPEMMF